jgi:phosphatidylserine synthase
MRFTMHKQDSSPYFSGLPSPAAALGVMGILIVYPEPLILTIIIGVITFLTISHIPCLHIMKQNISPKYL